MLPDQSLLICTSPRSGSNWLGELIGKTRQFGRPDEYFSVSGERLYERQLGRGAVQDYSRVFDYILRLGSTPNRRFATRLFWLQVAELETYFHRCGEFIGSDGLSILADQIPKISVLRLLREDHLRQAISHYRALRTNIWWKHKHIPVPNDQTCPFDYAAIRDLLLLIEDWERAWSRRLATFAAPQLVVTYAEMRRDLPTALNRIFGFLDIRADALRLATEAEFQVQADGLTDEWVERFVEIDAGRTSNQIGRDLAEERAASDRQRTVYTFDATQPAACAPTPMPGYAGVLRLDNPSNARPIFADECFLSAEECGILVSCLRRNRHLYSKLSSGSIFNDRLLWFQSLPNTEDAARRIMEAARWRLAARFRDLFGLACEPFPELPQLVLWRVGQSQAPHADQVHRDGRPNGTPKRDFAAIVYLNDGFQGGELHFPSRGVTVVPKAGMAVLLGGGLDYLHGVFEVTAGERCTMPLWLTSQAPAAQSELEPLAGDKA